MMRNKDTIPFDCATASDREAFLRDLEAIDVREGWDFSQTTWDSARSEWDGMYTNWMWWAWQAARLREKQAEKRMEDLYQAVHFCVSEDREINIIRLHDYCSGDDISAEAVIGEETKYGGE